jgi:membrane protein YdbS with pleckstrin-like domain
MSYVEEHLLPGETVQYQAHMHKLSFITPVAISVVLLAGAVAAFVAGRPAIGSLLVAAACLPLIYAAVIYSSSEFAVTNKRVIIKVGFVQRRTVETMLGKVENISVDQGVLGRMLDFGTITITGTGGTQEVFNNIASPLEFRRQVQGQISAGEGVQMVTSAAAREERDCPHCAERILTRARVCKHCNREVEPVA